jgi:hypothetical protein
LAPKIGGRDERINPLRVPPNAFVAPAVKLTVVKSADGHSELVADFATHRGLLRELDMMRIRWGSATNQARLRGNKPQVVSVTFSHRFADDSDLLFARAKVSSRIQRVGWTLVGRRLKAFELAQFCREQILNQLSIYCRELVF